MSEHDHVTDTQPVSVTGVKILAILSAVAAVIHFDVANSHYQEYWVFGAFMVGAALLQMAWAALAWTGSTRAWLLVSGALINAGIITVYIVTRAAGDIIGPTPHGKEPVGFGDLFCTVVEAAIFIGCLALLSDGVQRRVRPRQDGWALGLTGTAMASLLVVALLDGGSEMSMDMPAASPAAHLVATTTTHMAPGMKMASQASAVDLPTKSPAGDVQIPTMSQVMPGMAMASPMCTATPTAAQQQATVSLVNRSWRAAQKYRSLAAAKAAGYVPITPTGLPVVHYLNMSNLIATAKGRPVIDPAHPQALVYANTPKGAVLAATMYLMTSPGATDAPQPGGCLTPWHIHTNLCYGATGTIVGLTHDGRCPAGEVHRITPPMMHVWYVPIPGGPNAVDAPDNVVVHAAEHVKAPHNGVA
jgi:hypothetical protein